jgi:hypothetical protein
MQLDLHGITLIIPRIPLTPIIADSIRKDIAILAEARRDDGAAYFRIAFETVFGVLVPEMECAVRAGGAEGAVLGVEGDCVYGEDFCDVALRRVLLAVAFEGEV